MRNSKLVINGLHLLANFKTLLFKLDLLKRHEAIMWNPWNKVVQDHRGRGVVYSWLTNEERKKRNLPTPWTPELAKSEMTQAPVY